MAETQITFSLPSTLNAWAETLWSDTDHDLAWFIVLKFGKVEVASYYFAPSRRPGPTTDEIEQFVADRLKGLFA